VPPALLLLPLLAGLEVTADGDQLSVTNPGPFPVVGLRAGDSTRGRLEPGATWRTPRPDPAVVGGRFPLARWGDALADLDPAWAELHLRSAGLYLDAVDPGAPGEANAANLRALAAVDPDLAATWATGPPLRLALAARAAWHVPPGPLLTALLAAVDPAAPATPWPPAYARLESLPDLLRAAIESHGAAALQITLDHPKWAADRGLDATLARAWAPPATPTMAREDEALATALASGDRRRAARLGAEAHLGGQGGRLVCSALDLGVQTGLNAGQLLAAEAYLRFAARACPARPPIRQRAAQLTRARGERAFHAGRLTTAAEWFRAGWWIASEAADEGRLADTLAELALLRYERKEVEAGNAFLEQARAVAPLRPRVLDAFEARPHVETRIRVALVVVVIVMVMFLLRRLRRARRDRPESLSELRRRWRV